MKTSSLFLIALLNTHLKVSAADMDFNYLKNGADWPDKYPSCAGPTQSPIDLPTLGGNTKINTITYTADKFVKKYQNPLNAAVKWVGDTTKVALPVRKD